ncbi:MAG: beta-galactosidase [Actinomycetia bacterium]|nr:beta-galactosidase [Actinomycetes bacterium]
MKKKLFKDLFFYGTQFYRPPNPPKEERMEDLENVKKLGFNIIKIFAEWNWINYKEGLYDFEDLIEIIEKALDLEIYIDINTRIEQAPYWLAEKYPDSHYVNSNKLKIELQTRGNTPTGGWPGLCFDHPGAKLEAQNFLIQCAEVLGEYENVLIFDCWNEPHIEPSIVSQSSGIQEGLFCYCENTIRAYREWLKDKYKSIENLNEKWVKRFRDFNDINPPRLLIDYVEMTEWRKFMTWSMADKMRWRYKSLKDNLADEKFVMSHSSVGGISAGFSIYGADDYQLSESLDMFGLSLFPLWGKSNILDVCMHISLIRNMARKKTCINTELQGGQAHSVPSGLSRGKAPQRNDLRLWNFIDLAFGLKGIMYWQYRGEMISQEAPGFGLVKRDGSFTERSDEASKLCNFMNKYPLLFNKYIPGKSDIAILTIPNSYYLNFASESNEKFSIDSFKGIHRFLLKNNIYPEILVEEMLKEKISEYKVIFLTLPMVLNGEVSGLLKEFVEKGGILISDCAVGIFDEYGMAPVTVPSFGLDEIFGATQNELRYFDDFNREEGIGEIPSGLLLESNEKPEEKSGVFFNGVNKLKSHKLKVTMYLEDYDLTTAEPILKYENKIVGASNKYKKGKTYLIGTSFCQSLLAEDTGTENAILKILNDEGIVNSKNNGLLIFDLNVDGIEMKSVIIINSGKEKVKQSISFGKKIKIIDSYNKDFQYTLSGENLSFEINPEDANCIIYK